MTDMEQIARELAELGARARDAEQRLGGRAAIAELKLRRIAQLCDEAEEWNRSDKDTWFVITPERLRAILSGGAE